MLSFQFLFSLMFILVFGIIFFTLIRGIHQWGRNNASPRLSVDARIVDKRFHTTHHHSHNGHLHTSSSTSYYVTFEVQSGDRMELRVPRQEFGLLVEGDVGVLSFQGTRYLGFDRNRGL